MRGAHRNGDDRAAVPGKKRVTYPRACSADAACCACKRHLKLQSGASLDFDLTETGEAESTITQSYAEKGTAILKERLSALLKSAGMDVPAANIDIWYTQDDDGVVTVERVRVRVRFATDIDRADALLRSVLTEAIPVDVYV